jgi:hypothetical protein
MRGRGKGGRIEKKKKEEKKNNSNGQDFFQRHHSFSLSLSFSLPSIEGTAIF